MGSNCELTVFGQGRSQSQVSRRRYVDPIWGRPYSLLAAQWRKCRDDCGHWMDSIWGIVMPVNPKWGDVRPVVRTGRGGWVHILLEAGVPDSVKLEFYWSRVF